MSGAIVAQRGPGRSAATVSIFYCGTTQIHHGREHKSLQLDSSLTSTVTSALNFTCMSRVGDLLSDVVCSSQEDMVDLCVVSPVPLVFLILTRLHAISVAIFFFFFILLLCKQMHNRRIGCAVFSA